MHELGEKSSAGGELVVQNQGIESEQEFDFPYFKIPNGLPSKRKYRYMLDEGNEPKMT